MSNKAFGIFLLVCVGVLWILLGVVDYYAVYDFNANYLSEWTLADRSSTLTDKYVHINNFVNSIERDRGRFSDYNAIIFKTPQNKLDNNINALKSLQSRLEQIQAMDDTSFEYQTAIQQITAQEQGEAGEMISDIRGAFILKSYPIVYFSFFMIWALLLAGLCGIGTVLIMKDKLRY